MIPTHERLDASAQNMFTEFNMLPPDAQQMFDDELPDEITLVFEVFPDTSEREAYGFLTPACARLPLVLDLPEADPKRFGINSILSLVAPIGGSVNPLADLPPNQKLWYYDNLYAQIGFADSAKCAGAIGELGDVTMYAMTTYDAGVAVSGSVEPLDHPILAGDLLVKTVYTSVVGCFFRDRIMIWNRKLLAYRTALAVMMRATLMNRDPGREYQRFVNAGGEYFLEYPTLCP
jgi:hypothetical protein